MGDQRGSEPGAIPGRTPFACAQRQQRLDGPLVADQSKTMHDSLADECVRYVEVPEDPCRRRWVVDSPEPVGGEGPQLGWLVGVEDDRLEIALPVRVSGRGQVGNGTRSRHRGVFPERGRADPRERLLDPVMTSLIHIQVA